MNTKNKTILFSILFIMLLIFDRMAFNLSVLDILVAAKEVSSRTDNSSDIIDPLSDITDNDVEGDTNNEVTDANTNDDTGDINISEYEEDSLIENELEQDIENTQMDIIPDDAGEDLIPKEVEINSAKEVETNSAKEDLEIVESAIVNMSEIINSTNIVVYNFDEFKSALSGNNKYVNIYLGADISMKLGGIEIHSSKKSVTISGTNPLDGSGPFTINEYNSLDPGYTIRVVSTSGTKEVIMKDVNVIGRNYYGAVCVYDGVSGVKVTFENVNYNGPQISYNREGTVCITGKSNVKIIGDNGLSDAQELVEVNALELGGSTVIDHYSPLLSGIWMVGADSYIKILAGSDVTWNETGTYTIYQDNTKPANFIMEKGARFTINTLNGIFYNTSTAYHQFGDVLINSGATLTINQQGSTNIPILKVKNSIQVLDGASLIMVAQSAPQLLYMTGAADIVVKSPNTFVLYNKASNLIEWNDSDNHIVSISSTFINYWRNPCDIEVLGSFNDSPLYRWRKKNGKELTVEITTSSSSTKSVTSNYEANDYGEPPSEALLNMQTARIITAGKLLLTLDIISDQASYISGQTEPHALLYAVYTDVAGVEHTVYGQANSGGAFDISLQNGSFPMLDSTVIVYSSIGYKNVMESTIVVQTQENILEFKHVPNELLFPKTKINANKNLIPRSDNNWHIIIKDTRIKDSQWGLYARLKTPLTGKMNDFDYTIEDAVIFIDNDGNAFVLGDTAIKAASGVKADDVETIVLWPDDRGIMLDVETLKVCSNIKYAASIEWILVNGP